MSPHLAAHATREDQRSRILDALEESARADGPRRVVMAELARDLGMSTRTLYQHFPSKAELVAALMDRWADQIEADQETRATGGKSPYERLVAAAEGWLEGQCAFPASFWAQLERDFPVAFVRFQQRLREILDVGHRRLMPFIREDLDKELALMLMHASLRVASEPERCARLGLSRQEAMRQALEVWVRGTMRPVRAVHSPPVSD